MEGLYEHRYVNIPRVEEPQAGYLSRGEPSSLKAAALPSKPCQTTSQLVGKAYAAVDQASSALHTMEVLQAYSADLLEDQGWDLSPEVPYHRSDSQDHQANC